MNNNIEQIENLEQLRKQLVRQQRSLTSALSKVDDALVTARKTAAPASLRDSRRRMTNKERLEKYLNNA